MLGTLQDAVQLPCAKVLMLHRGTQPRQEELVVQGSKWAMVGLQLSWRCRVSGWYCSCKAAPTTPGSPPAPCRQQARASLYRAGSSAETQEEEDAGPAQGSFYTLRKLTCWWLLPDTIWGTYRQEELALLVLGGGQVSFTYCFSSAPCFA